MSSTVGGDQKRDAIAVSQRFANWLQMKTQGGHNFNQQLLSMREFRSPLMERRLIEYAGLRERGSNMDPRDYDPEYLPREEDYERLAKEQREAWEREHPTASANNSSSAVGENKKSITLEKSYANDSVINK